MYRQFPLFNQVISQNFPFFNFQARKIEKFNCIYCGKTAQDFSSIIDYNIIHHSDQELKIITSKFTKDSKIFTSTRTFGIIPQAIINDRKLIIPNNTTKSLKFHVFRIFMRNLYNPKHQQRNEESGAPRQNQQTTTDSTTVTRQQMVGRGR